MEPVTHSQLSRVFFILTVILVILAAIIGIGFYSTENGGPAPYMVVAAYIPLLISYYFHRKARKAESKKPSPWLKWLLIALIVIPIIFVALGIYSLWLCANDPTCQLFTF